MTATYIGAPIRRKKDRRFLSSLGQFVDDMKLPSPRQAAVVGGVACGIGNARREELVYDPAGQLLTGAFMGYLGPTASDMPEIRAIHPETPSPFTEGGVKGVSEAGTVGVFTAIGNAVADALLPPGRRGAPPARRPATGLGTDPERGKLSRPPQSANPNSPPGTQRQPKIPPESLCSRRPPVVTQ